MGRMERRRDPRFELAQPAKVQCQLTGRYLAGRTLDISSSGAMLWLDCPALLVPGQRVRLGVSENTRAPLLRNQQMIDATVVRSLGAGDGQRLALYFDDRAALAMTG